MVRPVRRALRGPGLSLSRSIRAGGGRAWASSDSLFFPIRERMAIVKPPKAAPARKPTPRRPSHRARIVVDANDARAATVLYDRKVIFTIRTDESGMYPSIVIAATDTYLKCMDKGRTGIVLWNGGAGMETRSRPLH